MYSLLDNKSINSAQSIVEYSGISCSTDFDGGVSVAAGAGEGADTVGGMAVVGADVTTVVAVGTKGTVFSPGGARTGGAAGSVRTGGVTGGIRTGGAAGGARTGEAAGGADAAMSDTGTGASAIAYRRSGDRHINTSRWLSGQISLYLQAASHNHSSLKHSNFRRWKHLKNLTYNNLFSRRHGDGTPISVGVGPKKWSTPPPTIAASPRSARTTWPAWPAGCTEHSRWRLGYANVRVNLVVDM